MSSYPTIRDPRKDHLLTPENSAVIIIDYQPLQMNSVNSMSRGNLAVNIVSVAKLAMGFKLPVVLSTVNAQRGDTVKILRDVLVGVPSIDRTSINSWEDKDFVAAVKATGRKKLIMCAIWTEACLTFPALDAMAEGYEVYAVADAVGGASHVAHKTALRRIEQAGAHLISVPQLACELQRDWNRQATVPVTVEVLTDVGSFLHL